MSRAFGKMGTVSRPSRCTPHPSGHGNPAAFAESLDEILGWDWQDTALVVEHCDAPRPGRRAEKGFLSFRDETEIVRAFRQQGRDVGMLVNWARSVIETGESRTAADHVAAARAAGVLSGLMFSGCSPEATEFGYPWIDAHLPAVEVEGAPASSMLNAHEIARCLREAGELRFTGLKIGLAPGRRIARGAGRAGEANVRACHGERRGNPAARAPKTGSGAVACLHLNRTRCQCRSGMSAPAAPPRPRRSLPQRR